MNSWTLGNTYGSLEHLVVQDQVATFNYPCVKTYECTYYHSVLPPGYYKLEVWGARGGNGKFVYGPCDPIGMGGYSVGVLHLTESSDVYVNVGGMGEDVKNPSTLPSYGGYNGGGTALGDHQEDEDDCEGSGGGGGASDIRIGNNNPENRVIVAGGGGGGSWMTCDKWDKLNGKAGFGGGLEAGAHAYLHIIREERATQNSGYNQKGIGQDGLKGGNSYGGGAGGGYWGGYSESDGQAGGGSGYIGKVISYAGITAQTIPGNESFMLVNGQTNKGNNGNGAARITMIKSVYKMNFDNPLNPFYEPYSDIQLNFTVPSISTNEHITITRTLDNEEITIYDNDDTGIDISIKDKFSAPSQTGKHQLIYKAISKDSLVTTNTFELLVNIPPKIKVLGRIKSSFAKQETSSISIEVFDDSFVNLYLTDKSYMNIQRKIECNYQHNVTNMKFIIPDYEVDTEHTIYIFAVDEYETKSNIIPFVFKIVAEKTPDINITNKLIDIYTYKERYISVQGFVSNSGVGPKLSLFGFIDNNLRINQTYEAASNSLFIYEINCPLDGLSQKVHYLKIYASDSYYRESNRIMHRFAYINNGRAFGFVSCNTREVCFMYETLLIFMIG